MSSTQRKESSSASIAYARMLDDIRNGTLQAGDRVTETELAAPFSGVVIGRTNLPLVYEGDAVFHVAAYGRKARQVEMQVEQFREEHHPEADTDPLPDPGEAPIA